MSPDLANHELLHRQAARIAELEAENERLTQALRDPELLCYHCLRRVAFALNTEETPE